MIGNILHTHTLQDKKTRTFNPFSVKFLFVDVNNVTGMQITSSKHTLNVIE